MPGRALNFGGQSPRRLLPGRRVRSGSGCLDIGRRWLAVVAFGLALVANLSSANATVLWDEGIQGDLAPETSPTPLVLGPGINSILGNIGGDPNVVGADAFDAFRFEVPSGMSWNHFVLRSYRASPPNETTGFAVYSGSDSLTGIFLNGAPAAVDGTDLLAALSLPPLGPGTYTVGVREFLTAGNLYELEVALIPEPCISSLLIGLIFPCLVRRRFQ